MDMFEKADRLKLRFDTVKGALSVEDLWDLPLTSGAGKANLDDVAKGLFRQLKDEGDVSFVTPSVSKDKTIQMKFDIVKHIIDVRVAENATAEQARANREKKQLILSIIAQKENEQLSNASLEDLQRLAESL